MTTQFTGPAQVINGTPIVQTVNIANSSTSGASGIQATIAAPSGLTVTSIPVSCGQSGPIITCPIGVIPANSTHTISVGMTPNMGGLLSPVTRQSDVDVVLTEASDNPSNNSASATISVRPPTADLSIDAAGSTLMPGLT